MEMTSLAVPEGGGASRRRHTILQEDDLGKDCEEYSLEEGSAAGTDAPHAVDLAGGDGGSAIYSAEEFQDDGDDALSATSRSGRRRSSAPRLWHRRGLIAHLLHKGTLDANSRYHLRWEAAVFMFLLHHALFVPLFLGLREYLTAGSLLDGMRALFYLGDVMFLFDIYVTSRTGMIHEGFVIRDLNRVRQAYLRSWFPVDFVASFPFDWFIPGTYRRVHVLVRLLRLVRLMRLRRYFEAWERYASSPTGFRLFKLLLSLYMIVHWLACAYIGLAYSEGFGTSQYIPDESFLTALDRTDQYVFALHWAASATLFGGFGIEAPTTTNERVFSLLTIVISVLVLAVVIGNVTNTLSNASRDQQQFNERVDSITRFMKMRRLPPHIKNKVRRYFDYLWSRQHGQNDNEVLQQLPSHLRSDISQCLHQDLISKVPFFKDAVPGFINALVEHLEPRIYPQGDEVVQFGDQGREVFFVRRGRLSVVSAHGNVLGHLTEGGFFGEIALLYRVKRTATVRADTFCDILVLTRSDFEAVLENFPEQKAVLQHIAQTRLQHDHLQETLRAFHLFRKAPQNFIWDLVRFLRPYSFAKDDEIIKAGEWGTDMFFLTSGHVDVVAQGRVVKSLEGGHGNFFGEIAVLFATQRTATVRAKTACEAYSLSKDDLESVLADYPEQRKMIKAVAATRLLDDRERYIEFLRNIPVLADAADDFLLHLVKNLEQETLIEGDSVGADSVGSSLLLVNYGSISLDFAGKSHKAPIATFSQGTFFSEWSLVADKPLPFTYRAEAFCDMFVLTRAVFEAALDKFPGERTRVDAHRKRFGSFELGDFLAGTALLRNCSSAFVDHLHTYAKAPVTVKKNALITVTGTPSKSLWILLEGKAAPSIPGKDDVGDTIEPPCLIGSTGLVREFTQVSIVALTPCTVVEIEIEAIHTALLCFRADKAPIQEAAAELADEEDVLIKQTQKGDADALNALSRRISVSRRMSGVGRERYAQTTAVKNLLAACREVGTADLSRLPAAERTQVHQELLQTLLALLDPGTTEGRGGL